LGPERLRVLLVGEGATLAHAARPLALASALPQGRFEAILATPERYRDWVPQRVQWLPLETQPPAEFAERLAQGRPLFPLARLKAYVAQDLELIERTRPDVIVGDLRPSLAASARKAGAPYISISNAYWSPDRPLRPVRPTVDRLRGWPAPAADLAFRALAPMALGWHARPMDELLAAHGLRGVGRDLRRAFTEADVTLYADIPALFPDVPETPERRFLGPVAWEPPIAPPPWWDRLPDDKPIAYVTLGSSGDAEAPAKVTGWLTAMGYAVVISTAGRARLHGDDQTVFVADFVPGLAASERADLVVCNGGSPTATQALLKGRPVLGIASNLDQFMNMRAVKATGAGLCLRADALSRGRFEAAVNRLSGFRAMKAAAAFAAGPEPSDPGQVLAGVIEELAAARR
jgi:UDP:flavonoid glycosyltransferase YjiC (YdhE family)